MKKEYDFSKAIKNPYIDKQLKKQISMNINADTIEYYAPFPPTVEGEGA